jgi:hypothetical protein
MRWKGKVISCGNDGREPDGREEKGRRGRGGRKIRHARFYKKHGSNGLLLLL